MSKIIIGIHGLRNKPPKRTLKRWWKKSIREGLHAIDHPPWFFRFDLVYWADLLHPVPFNPRIRDKSHPLFLKAPYMPVRMSQPKKPSRLRKAVLDALLKEMDYIFLNDDLSINFEAITDIIIRRFFEDLDAYYSKTISDRHGKERPVKELIREKLAYVLRKHQRKKILLIAHSMGSIIAYDVLTITAPDINIDTLVTIGSPLGIPIIEKKCMTEQNESKQIKKLKTPDNITKAWYNFSDLRDKVALDYALSDDYEPNSKGIRPVDQETYNNYEFDGESNPHKSYGYLRTPELTKVIHDFLA
jgi:hypothetical protein